MHSVSWSNVGQHLAAGAADGVVIVWSTFSGEPLVSYAHDGGPVALAFSPTGPQLASVSAGELALWSPDSHMVFKDAVSSWAGWRFSLYCFAVVIFRASCTGRRERHPAQRGFHTGIQARHRDGSSTITCQASIA